MITRTVLAAAALALIASPAHAQSFNVTANGSYGQVTLESGFIPDPYSVTVAAGGPIVAIERADDECNGGYIPSRATFSLRYEAGDYPTLYIAATSEADTTIAVRGPNGAWYCNDDSAGLNPMVAIESPRTGRYQIFVGRFGVEDETAAAMLHISEIGGPSETSVGDGAMPDYSLDPAYGTVELTSGFTPDPHTMAIAAGGNINAQVLEQPGCYGWIAAAPDYRLNFTAGSSGLPLIFSVESAADTVLVINDAEGNWLCDDDSGGDLNPMVAIGTPASGQYDIWVGTFAEGGLQDSTLSISEIAQ